MEIICEKDCRSCLAKDCPQRRCPALDIIVPQESQCLPEQGDKPCLSEQEKQANLFG
jgi:hypothetical protein